MKLNLSKSKIRSERLAKKRRENSKCFSKRLCHPRSGEETALSQLLFFLGVPRGDGETNRVLKAGDPFRVYRTTALKHFLTLAREYSKLNEGPIVGHDISSKPKVKDSDLSPELQKDESIKPQACVPSTSDKSPEVLDQNSEDENSGKNDMSKEPSSGAEYEHEELWDMEYAATARS